MSPSVVYPLPDHPEFSIIGYPGSREYRLEHQNTSNASQSSRLLNVALNLFSLAGFITISIHVLSGVASYLVLLVSSILWIRHIFFQVLYESVILLPPHGVQLETHRGFTKKWPLTSTRYFIPTTTLTGVVITEGLNGWNVLYYLAFTCKANAQSLTSLRVAFQHLLPCHSILLQLFEGVHETSLVQSCYTTRDVTKIQ